MPAGKAFPKIPAQQTSTAIPFKGTATCFENLVKHLELSICQLKELQTKTTEGAIDLDKLENLVHQIEDLLVSLCDIYD